MTENRELVLINKQIADTSNEYLGTTVDGLDLYYWEGDSDLWNIIFIKFFKYNIHTLIFINDLSGNLVSNPNLSADDTAHFLVVHQITLSAKNLNNDLKKINKWAFQWKAIFNLYPNKQTQEVILSRKLKKPNHPSLNFNNTVVIQSTQTGRFGFGY